MGNFIENIEFSNISNMSENVQKLKEKLLVEGCRYPVGHLTGYSKPIVLQNWLH